MTKTVDACSKNKPNMLQPRTLKKSEVGKPLAKGVVRGHLAKKKK